MACSVAGKVQGIVHQMLTEKHEHRSYTDFGATLQKGTFQKSFPVCVTGGRLLYPSAKMILCKLGNFDA